MVNVTVKMIGDPWHDLALSYAPAGSRDALMALFALDAALGDVLRTTREPIVGQMRLAWWRDALARLDSAPAPGEPVLQALAGTVVPSGVTGARLSEMVDGWEPLLGEVNAASIGAHAHHRGCLMFEAAAELLNAAPSDPVGLAGKSWALGDLAGNLSDGDGIAIAKSGAEDAFADLGDARWSRNGRVLGAFALIAHARLSGELPASFVLRLARFRLTGR